MKHFILFILATLSISLHAQINGNGTITTTTIQLEDFTSIDISLYAEVTIDASASTSELTITIDENLMDQVGMEVVDGRLYIDQKKWISPSDDVIISIKTPQLEYIEQGTHDKTMVVGIDRETFTVMALVGEVVLHGKVNQLNANAEVGKITATDLAADIVRINLWSWGTIRLGSPDKITGKATDGGKVYYNGSNTTVNVNTKSDAVVMNADEALSADYSEHQYIDLKIKNNSEKRLHAFVRGPKPDGSSFSYGFPMRPNQTRKERWTVGTKVYRKGALGKRELVELTAADAGTTVMLF